VLPALASAGAAIAAARGDFLVFLDGGDILEREALLELSQAREELPYDICYSDETLVGRDDTETVQLKPGWSPELLTTYNYFGRLTAIDAGLARRAVEALGAAPRSEWELNLWASRLTPRIERLPRILSRRRRGDRTRRDDAALGRSVLETYLAADGIAASAESLPNGLFRAVWPLPAEPKISIVIPNKNRFRLISTCIDGLLEKTDYRNIEIIVVDNGSTDADVRAYYESCARSGVRIVAFDEEFNYSRACNRGAEAATGELLLFLNNDIEVTDPDWLTELVRRALVPGVGVVGPKLLYPDGEIQHAGVALGLFTLAAHIYHRTPAAEWGVYGPADLLRNWMAVTGACQLIRRDVFELAGGYDEDFILSYSDIELCARIWKLGFRIVYTPFSVLTHHEGASRGHTNPTDDQILFARRLQALGIGQDPYFHPGLDAFNFAPRLRPGSTKAGIATQLRIDIERMAQPFVAKGAPDAHDDGALAVLAGADWNAFSGRTDIRFTERSAADAARLILTVLGMRRDLRRRFPLALSEGAKGEFADYMKRDALRTLGLGPDYAPWIDAAFAAGFGDRLRQVAFHDRALREREPLLMLPSGRKALLPRLYEVVGIDDLPMAELRWLLASIDEQPVRELMITWATNPDWQEAVPAGGTVFGLVELVRWAAERHGIGQDWLFRQTTPAIMSDAQQVRVAYRGTQAWQDLFPRALEDEGEARALLEHLARRLDATSFLARDWLAARDLGALAREVVRPGLNVLGHFSYPSGLRISVESLAAGLAVNGVPTSLRNVPVSLATDVPLATPAIGCEPYDVTMIHVQPEPLFGEAFRQGGLRPRSPRSYRVGYWYWEFGEIPESWDRAAMECDELWTATSFVAEGLRERYRQPVRVFLPGLELPAFEAVGRRELGLEEGVFTLAFVFHMTSVMERKNPVGLIRAFREAFGDSRDARLVIKTSFGERHPDHVEALREAAEDANVTIIDEVWTYDRTMSLIQASDAYVSLHRSEGLGLTMAEAMLLGRPVIGSRYSGNLEFMNDDNSLLVDCTMVKLNRVYPPYAIGQSWAQPSTAHAAEHMRKLFEDRDFARDLGERGRRSIAETMSYAASGRRMAEHLATITDRLRG